jgi:DNA adenine methylase
MSTTRYNSPLRYPGGKAKLANYLKLIMIENGLVGHDYVEPYAGGASVALELLYEGYAGYIHINDLNPGVHAFWNSALNQTAELCSLIEKTPVTVDEWRRQRAVQASVDADPLNLGFSTFYLNRTNRSGIISGGVIGGLRQDGPWKIDARYNREELIRRIRKVGRHRSQISLTSIDARQFINRWIRSSCDATFLYLDPPYFVKGEGLYDNFYDSSDHAAIASAVAKLSHPWVVSYDAAPQIIELYSKFTNARYELAYSANARIYGSEVMFYSHDLRVPSVVPREVRTSDIDRAKMGSIDPRTAAR